MPHAQLHGLTGKLVVAVARQHHKGHVRVLLLGFADHLNAVHHRHLDVHNGKVGLVLCNFFQPLGTVARRANHLHLIGIPRNELRHTLALDLLIVHDQQRMQHDLPFFVYSITIQ